MNKQLEMSDESNTNSERLFEYIMKTAVQTPNDQELGKKIRELAIKKGYYNNAYQGTSSEEE